MSTHDERYTELFKAEEMHQDLRADGAKVRAYIARIEHDEHQHPFTHDAYALMQQRRIEALERAVSELIDMLVDDPRHNMRARRALRLRRLNQDEGT